MLHENYTSFIGHRYDDVAESIKADFPGTVVVYTPGDTPDEDVNPSRLKIFVSDQNIIIKIVNG